MPEHRCIVCRKLLSGLRFSAMTCSDACRKKKSRMAKKRDSEAVERFEAYAEECTTEPEIVDPARNGATEVS